MLKITTGAIAIFFFCHKSARMTATKYAMNDTLEAVSIRFIRPIEKVNPKSTLCHHFLATNIKANTIGNANTRYADKSYVPAKVELILSFGVKQRGIPFANS